MPPLKLCSETVIGAQRSSYAHSLPDIPGHCHVLNPDKHIDSGGLINFTIKSL